MLDRVCVYVWVCLCVCLCKCYRCFCVGVGVLLYVTDRECVRWKGGPTGSTSTLKGWRLGECGEGGTGAGEESGSRRSVGEESGSRRGVGEEPASRRGPRGARAGRAGEDAGVRDLVVGRDVRGMDPDVRQRGSGAGGAPVQGRGPCPSPTRAGASV